MMVMSLLIWYWCIPLYFTFMSLSIYHRYPSHMMHLCNIPHDTHKTSQSLTHSTCPCWPCYWLHHQTSFVYGMHRWPTDLTAIFSGPHAVSLMIIPLFSSYQFTTVIHDGSAQLPNLPWGGLTGLKPLHHMVSESEDWCCFTADDPCAHFFLDKSFVFNCWYFLHTTEKFSLRVWTWWNTSVWFILYAPL